MKKTPIEHEFFIDPFGNSSSWLSSLRLIHNKNLIHRDIKGSNILFYIVIASLAIPPEALKVSRTFRDTFNAGIALADVRESFYNDNEDPRSINPAQIMTFPIKNKFNLILINTALASCNDKFGENKEIIDLFSLVLFVVFWCFFLFLFYLVFWLC